MNASDEKSWDDLGRRLRAALTAHESDNGEALAQELGRSYALLFESRLQGVVHETWKSIANDPRREVSEFTVQVSEILNAAGCVAFPRRHFHALQESACTVGAITEVFERHYREKGSEEPCAMLTELRRANAAILEIYTAVKPPASATQH
jgi:hypothetical protein